MLEKLQTANGDVKQLKQWEKRSYQAYQIEKIKSNLLITASRDEQIQLIRKHILSQTSNDLGASCIDIYLVAYVAEEFRPGKQAFFEYVLKNGITDKENTAQAIWQVGKGDGIYLGLLHDDGSVRDWDFFSLWVTGPDSGGENQRTVHNKLVRDGIPEIIESSGKKPSIKILKHDEYIKELQRKAFEELNEYVETESREDALEELADLLEVIHALAASHDYTIEDVEKKRQQKAVKRGSFKDRIYLLDVDDK